MVRRSLIRQLFAWGAAVTFLLYLVYLNRDYVRGFVRGPRPVAASDLATMATPDGSPQFFVRVSGSRTVETGIEEYEVKTESGREVNREVSSVFYALAMGDKFLIVKSSGGIQNPVEGSLAPIPQEFDQRFFDSKEMQAQRGRFYPFLLDAQPYRTGGYWAIAGILAFLGLLIWKARPVWRWLKDPDSHPVMARALTWGDPISISAALQRELRAPEVQRATGWTLTDCYLVRRTAFTFNVLRFRDLLWAYKKVTKHSVNFIPTGKTYTALLICHGGSAELSGSQAKVDEYLQFAARKAPWAVFGYTQEIANLFRTNQAGFRAAVEERRQQQGTT